MLILVGCLVVLFAVPIYASKLKTVHVDVDVYVTIFTGPYDLVTMLAKPYHYIISNAM